MKLETELAEAIQEYLDCRSEGAPCSVADFVSEYEIADGVEPAKLHALLVACAKTFPEVCAECDERGMVERHEGDAVGVECPRCGGTGQLFVPEVAALTEAA